MKVKVVGVSGEQQVQQEVGNGVITSVDTQPQGSDVFVGQQ